MAQVPVIQISCIQKLSDITSNSYKLVLSTFHVKYDGMFMFTLFLKSCPTVPYRRHGGEEI
jgi:hypothetical protein